MSVSAAERRVDVAVALRVPHIPRTYYTIQPGSAFPGNPVSGIPGNPAHFRNPDREF